MLLRLMQQLNQILTLAQVQRMMHKKMLRCTWLAGLPQTNLFFHCQASPPRCCPPPASQGLHLLFLHPHKGRLRMRPLTQACIQLHQSARQPLPAKLQPGSARTSVLLVQSRLIPLLQASPTENWLPQRKQPQVLHSLVLHQRLICPCTFLPFLWQPQVLCSCQGSLSQR
jgi:hypothetical protein